MEKVLEDADNVQKEEKWESDSVGLSLLELLVLKAHGMVKAGRI